MLNRFGIEPLKVIYSTARVAVIVQSYLIQTAAARIARRGPRVNACCNSRVNISYISAESRCCGRSVPRFDRRPVALALQSIPLLEAHAAPYWQPAQNA